MELGLNLGYWGAGNDADNIALAQEADRLGYSVVWAAEAYGSDAPTVLAWVGAQTERIDLGAAVMQIPARTPAMTAMTAATLDTLSGGRFRLGPGRLRSAGERGLARRAVRRPARRAPASTSTSSRMALRRETRRVRGQALDPAAAGRSGQGAAADRPPGPRAAADLPRRGRAEEPRARRRDRRRLAGHLLQPRVRRRPARRAHRRRGHGRPGHARAAAGRLRRRADGAGRDRRRPRRRPPSRCATTPRCTSAGWGRGRRTSTTRWPCGWASSRRPPRCRTSTSPAGTGTPRRRCRWSSSTRPR